jgi:hypothetical protein
MAATEAPMKWTMSVLALALVVVPWAVLALMGREVIPASIELTGRLFALTLVLSYVSAWLLAIAISRTRRLMIYRALATTLVAVVLVSILELPAALHRIHWEAVFRRLTGEGRDYGAAYVHDAALGFRRIPGIRWSGRVLSDVERGSGLPRTAERPITFTYDRWGYRNAVEMARADVVLVGDSYVEGWYVDDAETVAARLAERLGVPVANLGVAGYGTLQELIVLRSDALARLPRTIVWVFFEGNDLYDDQSFESSRLAAPPTAEETTPHREGLAAAHGWRRRSFTLNAVRWLRRVSHPLVPNRAPYWANRQGEASTADRIYFADYAKVPWTDYERGRWKITRAAFEDGVALARSRGAEIAFVYAPIKFRVYRDVLEIPADSPLHGWAAWTELPVLFQEFCAENGVRCLDLTEPFARAVREGVPVFARTDTHWGPAGHDLAARELERFLAPHR